MKHVPTNTTHDPDLREAVIRQLSWEPGIRSKDIAVTARDGVITLSGFTHSYNEKFEAERATKAVYGVLGVANDIEVKLAPGRTDPEIARDAVAALETNISIPDKSIKVSVRDGVVILDGKVEWNFQRESAESCVRTVPGVAEIRNNVAVKPRISTAAVEGKIEDALKRSAEVDARRITVTANSGTVHLYGNVRSWAERDTAQRAAWAAPGVAQVHNHLSIVP